MPRSRRKAGPGAPGEWAARGLRTGSESVLSKQLRIIIHIIAFVKGNSKLSLVVQRKR